MADALRSAPIRSAAFRFALLLGLVFAVGAAALLLVVQQQIDGYAREATDGGLRAEAAILKGEYAQLGLSGLTDAMDRRRELGEEAQFRYLLSDAAGRRLYGDLPGEAARPGWNTIEVIEENATSETMTSLGTRLPDGLLLVIATDNFDVRNMRDRLLRFTLLSGVGIALFAVLGGYLTGRLFLRRLDRVNLAVDRIIEGDRSERLPMIGFGPEFDALARNLNRMLDRNTAAMEALRQVSTDIAHDLRTPLTRLHQRLEQMRESEPIDPAMVDEALGQTDEILATFQALLRIGTAEGGVGRQRFRSVDLSELMDRIHLAYEPVAEDAEHGLTADHQAGVVVNGDPELLAQLLTNLIENAIVHTPLGTRIVSRLYHRDGRPIVEISDDGPGVPVHEREKIFRRFYRLDVSRSTKGTGLGLALVAAIAALHRAELDTPDERTGFSVRLTFPDLYPGQ